ncbi:MAG TPA: flagellar basal body L-ring protein FlgH [Pseudobdellovibrionaceae bacterium]|nr:flagellar basal body L-ring protein FlgH [Pseudobdellovibrionaceae bacterium]
MIQLKYFLFFVMFYVSACSTLGWFGENKTPSGVETQASNVESKSSGDALKYSESAQAGVYSDRQYKHMTRSQMEEQSELGSQAGSTWVMDGQGAYLFAQNKIRKEGDVLNVLLDGSAFKQVETKVTVIKQLLAQLEAQLKEKELLQRSLASVGAPESAGAGAGAVGAAGAAVVAKPVVSSEKNKKEDEEIADIKTITTKIIERMADGNYRIRGSQPFMIGKREYKVIVAGIIRPEDYNDQGVSSQKILDPQFDVVSIRRGEPRQ